ncbi:MULTISPECIES: vWA domain-containing protein [Haloferacaceae]|uniref:VWA domain-containing protein n=1 Tax=Halorubrum glutamatedens TaxID=2707018 RepID=A0ABD5QVC5_9EURY|nr:VWA domain-containing protein [Halobellus captivus]
MSDKNGLEISRRKALAGIGGIGVASAGAGLGTSAYFSDEESFEDNSLTAGELDLKLDYKATYAGGPGRLDEIDGWYSDEGPGEPFNVTEVDGEEGTYLIGEVPDATDDIWEDEVQETDLCAPDLGLINGDEIPVFTLDDVKPGDSGEVTVSLHICDNPAWMYMNGELTANDENTVTEPEAESDEENNDETDTSIDGDGELADKIETTLWYDENCNNVLDGGEESGGNPLCVQMVLDESGSLVVGGSDAEDDVETGADQLANTVLNNNDDSSVGYTTFQSTGEANVANSVTDPYTSADISPVSGQQTYAGEGIELARQDLENCPEGHDRIMVVFTDGGFDDPSVAESQAQTAKDNDIEVFAIGVAGANQSQLENIASEPVDSHVFSGTSTGNIESLFSQVSETITEGEEVIESGSLAEVMAELEEGIALDGNRSTEEDEPFAGGMTHCLGFEWELPADVGNEVQTDSVAFDLGFYALQSRHNDDPPAEPFNGTYQDDNGLPSNGTANASD